MLVPPRWMTGCAPTGSHSKKTAHASEQERANARAARRRWRKRQDWLKRHLHLLDRIVFIDETGLNTKMARLRGWSAKGQRLVASIPHGHWKTMTFIAGLRHDSMTAPWVLDGPMPLGECRHSPAGNRWPGLRHLHQNPTRTDPAKGRCCGDGQSACPQGRRCQSRDQ